MDCVPSREDARLLLRRCAIEVGARRGHCNVGIDFLLLLRGGDFRDERMLWSEGHVGHAEKRIGPGGGNEVWERGVLRPDETLADLIAIFHPELIGQRELVYYERLLSDR